MKQKIVLNRDGTVSSGNKTFTLTDARKTKKIFLILSIVTFILGLAYPFLFLVFFYSLFMFFRFNKILKAFNNANEVSQDYIDESYNKLADSKNNIDKTSINFKAAGVTKKNDDGTNIQTIIKRIVKAYKDTCDNEELYFGLSGKELRVELEETGDNLFELDDVLIDDTYLVKDPNNQFDSNAIKIMSNQYGHLGYVPKTHTSIVNSLFNSSDIVMYVDAVITGGKYKYYDYDEDKVCTDSLYYGLSITI